MARDPAAPAPALRIRGATKSYGSTRALRGVDLDVPAGAIHAIVGENGAGKSTLMKVLSGAVRADGGTIEIHGEAYAPTTPGEARSAGVAMIYQELNLCPDLSVFDNVTLGVEGGRGALGIGRDRDGEQRLGAILGELGVRSFGPRTRAGDLGPADRQLVEIARALFGRARLLILDEPTSSLGPDDARRLGECVRRLAGGGVTVLWISHFLDEVTALCGSYTALRDGRTVGSGDLAGMAPADLAALMVGRDLDGVFPRTPADPGDVALEVRGLSSRRAGVRDISLRLRRGEILGVFGLVGAGRTEMLRALVGLDPARGDVRVDGRAVEPRTPRALRNAGVSLLSEDRGREGLAVRMSIADNACLGSLAGLARLGFVAPRTKREAIRPHAERLRLRAAGLDAPVDSLSGGNQQKVAIARLLRQGARVLLLDEPTRGIDIGAKAEVYGLLDELRRDGHAILVCSSYLPELMGLADRIAVMRRGRLGEARPVARWTEPGIMEEAASSAR